MEDWGNNEGGVLVRTRTAMFDTKSAQSDGASYSVADAERKDLAYMVEHSCLSCNKLMKNSDVKIVPPRYLQERDEYVRSGMISRRLMCVGCYNALKTVTKSKTRYRVTSATRKTYLIKSIINNLLLKE